MGFLTAKAETIDHPYFGTLIFMEIKKRPENSAFEGKKYFPPINKEIEFHLTGQKPGPSEKQVQFFKNLENNWHEVAGSVKPIIEAEFQNWKEDFVIKDFNKEFVFTFISIPTLESKNYEWELTFETDYDQNHIFTVYFENMTPQGVGVDG